MQHNKSGEFLAYWIRLRGSRAAPERSEITPSAIASQLANIFILQTSNNREPRFRLAGTQICAIYGRELKHVRFTKLWQAKDRAGISRLLANCMTEKSTIRINFEGKTLRGRKALFELVLLPLAGEAREKYLIGTIVALGRPFWLEADPIAENRIQSISNIDLRLPAHGQPNDFLLPGPRNGPRAMTASENLVVGRKIGHLRVVPGGKILDQDRN